VYTGEKNLLVTIVIYTKGYKALQSLKRML